jgi:hypothetical protein
VRANVVWEYKKKEISSNNSENKRVSVVSLLKLCSGVWLRNRQGRQILTENISYTFSPAAEIIHPNCLRTPPSRSLEVHSSDYPLIRLQKFVFHEIT